MHHFQNDFKCWLDGFLCLGGCVNHSTWLNLRPEFIKVNSVNTDANNSKGMQKREKRVVSQQRRWKKERGRTGE